MIKPRLEFHFNLGKPSATHRLNSNMLTKFSPLLALVSLFLVSCAKLPPLPGIPAREPVIKPPSEVAYANPYPAGTYQHFTAEPNYKKTYNIYRNHSILSTMSPDTASLTINLSTQRAQLLSNNQVAIDYPVATGKSSHPTPPGNYTILEKIKDKRSNLYGRILDANGNVVKGDADARTDKVPAGGKFLGAKMPYWMRFTNTGIGHHVGNVPRYPASHGCIRGKTNIMPEIFAKVKTGTPVSIVE